MDPTANLAEQRRIQERLSSDAYRRNDRLDDLERLAELAEALDQWCSNGGFRPAQWSHNLPKG